MPKDQSPEELAYQIALERIAEARASGATKLDLSGETTVELRKLTRLPPEIALLPDLRELLLGRTEITDIAALSYMTGIQKLWLSNTPIIDISALRGMIGMQTLGLDNTRITNISALRGMTGMQRLELDNTHIADISALRQMTNMRMLWLSNTHITDISALQDMTGIRELKLHNTQISDLSPLRFMETLTGRPPYSGLHIANTPAAHADPILAEYAAIQDDAERTQKIMAYLREKYAHPDPAEAQAVPTPDFDPAIPLVVTEDGLDLPESHPAAQDANDRIKRKTHERLRSEADNLFKVVGNVFPQLARSVRLLADSVAVDFAELEFLDLHFEYEVLNDIYTRRGERIDGEKMGDDVVTALFRVLSLIPPLTFGNALVEEYKARKADPAPPIEPEDQQADREILATIADPKQSGEVVQPRLQHVAALFTKAGPALAPNRHKLMRNVLIGLGRLVALQKMRDSASQAFGAAAGAYAFVLLKNIATQNWPSIVRLGPDIANWLRHLLGGGGPPPPSWPGTMV